MSEPALTSEPAHIDNYGSLAKWVRASADIDPTKGLPECNRTAVQNFQSANPGPAYHDAIGVCECPLRTRARHGRYAKAGRLFPEHDGTGRWSCVNTASVDAKRTVARVTDNELRSNLRIATK